MRKRLVVCCDGTWNRADQHDHDGVAVPTNVVKLSEGVADAGEDGTPQRRHYEPGVGTKRIEHLRGGAFGFGLSRNVCDCYRFLVENYDPGDELYFFGFSRGAFTARSLAGLVRNAGILRPENLGRVDEAYRLYRSRENPAEPSGSQAERFRREYSQGDETRIRFVGVWDTVGSLGIPTGPLRLPMLTKLWSFHDTQLSRWVDVAYHALAIDERRGQFTPTLWKQHDDPGDQKLEQVWFSGVHSDVGGGYREPELAEIALLWMVKGARAAGLEFRTGHFEPTAPPIDPQQRRTGALIGPDALGKMHESLKGFFLLFPRHQRVLDDQDGSALTVASSAEQRKQEDSGYDAPNLQKYLAADGPITPVTS